MSERDIDVVRRFNRVVTERIGALNEAYLDRGRPLGASRLLWEIGLEGADARSLRARLDLDSGYLSRLLQRLDAEGLIERSMDDGDRRIRTVSLTAAGRRELAVLDDRSDALAADLLATLPDRQRAQLVDAAGRVERLLTAGLVTIDVDDADGPDARHCLDAYFAELDTRFDRGFDPARSISADAEELTMPAGLLLVARLRGRPIGCGALKFHEGDPAEIKRMWVADDARGLGLGRRLLAELEQRARAAGVTVVRLETNRSLVEAIALYRSAGYEEVDAFNDEAFAHHWFEKRLDRPATTATSP